MTRHILAYQHEILATNIEEAEFIRVWSVKQDGTKLEALTPSIFNVNDRDSSYDERENLQIIK